MLVVLLQYDNVASCLIEINVLDGLSPPLLQLLCNDIGGQGGVPRIPIDVVEQGYLWTLIALIGKIGWRSEVRSSNIISDGLVVVFVESLDCIRLSAFKVDDPVSVNRYS